MKKKKEKRIIGHTDQIDLPEFDLVDLPCKIDTGADSSAIHCHQIRLIQENGRDFISFRLLDPTHEAYNHREFKTANFREKKIKNSFGQSEYRYSITCQTVLFGQTFTADFTLADRINMRFPVLLGRKLLRNRFLVDVSQRDLSFKSKQ